MPALQWANVFMIGFFLYGPQMLIGLCGAELVGPDSVGASEGFLGWIAYLGAANAGARARGGGGSALLPRKEPGGGAGHSRQLAVAARVPRCGAARIRMSFCRSVCARWPGRHAA